MFINTLTALLMVFFGGVTNPNSIKVWFDPGFFHFVGTFKHENRGAIWVRQLAWWKIVELGFQEKILLSGPQVFLMGYPGSSTNLPLRGMPRQAVTPQQPAGMDGREQSWKPLHHHPAQLYRSQHLITY